MSKREHRSERESNGRGSPSEKMRRRHEDDDYERRKESRRRDSPDDRRDSGRHRHRDPDSRSPRRRSMDRPIKREPDSDEEGDRRRRRQENEDRRGRRENDRRRIDDRKRKGDGNPFEKDKEESGKYEWGKREMKKEEEEEEKPIEKEKPNFGLSGKLATDTNMFNGVVVKYNEPPEARKPKVKWRLYPFKGEESMPVLHIHRQSAYLIGRDRRVADIPIDHPSCSKQHAAVQYRVVKYERPDGSTGRRIRPYIIDLASANGTFLNNQKIDSQRYIELQEKDVLKFGFSSREYVLLNETSQQEDSDAEAEAEAEPPEQEQD